MPRLTLNAKPIIWSKVVTEAVRSYPLETGGLLMGRRQSEHDFILQEVIGPGPKAEHERSTFNPDQLWQEQEVETAWRRHQGEIEYLGDWHTHPDGSARASRLDRDVARRIAAAPGARAPAPLILIVSLSDCGAVRPATWLWTGRRFVGVSLQLVATRLV